MQLRRVSFLFIFIFISSYVV